MDKKELSNLEDLKIYSETAGGLYIKNTTKDVVVNTIANIVNNYKTLPHQELIALCSSLNANLSMYQLLTGVEDQIESIKQVYETEKESNR